MSDTMYNLDVMNEIRDDQIEWGRNLKVNPVHYTELGIEPWDYIIKNNLGYLEGNIIKYVSRYKKKGGREDLLKARTYLDKLLETNN